MPPRYRTPYFSHIMGGYAAAYYAYIWSEVLDANTVEYIKAHGGLKRENGDRLRDTLLSRGGSKDAKQLFLDFTGHEPRIEPLLKKRGLDAKQMIDYLRQNKLGRATFLPVQAMTARTLSTAERRVLTMRGCVGVASELCTFDPRYRPVMENLLDDISFNANGQHPEIELNIDAAYVDDHLGEEFHEDDIHKYIL